uniref:efflux RND transporter periplasmic adaptor subunit n=1 Tax=Pseudomonas laurentiana TaxID=2364649 RepID=UPI0029C6EC33|nr:efflux RND transporter periplasmic adaptor subunit [Pseudomonas laurentiana]
MKPAAMLLGTCLLLVACTEEHSEEPVRPVLTLRATSQGEQQLGRFAGSIQARYETNLGFRVGGRIAQRHVDVGTEVAKDGLLATLDPTDQRNQLRAAEGDLAKIQAQLINAQANARRQQQLYDRGVGARAQLDIAQTNLKTTKATLDQASAAFRLARDQLGYTELHTDHAGVVTAWQAEAGQTVTAGQPVATLARPDVKEAVIDLPITLAEQLPKGVHFYVEAQLDPSTYTSATLRELEPQADAATRTRRARLTLAESPLGFRLGTAISVSLSSPVTPRVELPPSAVQDSDGQSRVWVVDEQQQTVSPRDVKVLERTDEWVALASGVQVGERVVSAGVHSLKPGQKVKLDEVGP